MSTIRTGVFHVYERFPQYKDTIKARFARSETFKTLCADYTKCHAALRYWDRSAAKEAALRRQEYRTLLHELEEEIMQYLDPDRP